MSLESLSNDELRQQLKAHGVDVGPVTPTTRGVYMKKLMKLQADSPAAAFASPAGDNADQVPDEPMIQKNVYPLLNESEPEPRQHIKKSSFSNENESDYEEGEESMRFLTEEEMLADMERSRRSSPLPAKSSSFTRVLYALAVVIIAIFIFFMFENASKGNKDIV